MLTSMDMYWLTRLDSLNSWLSVVCAFVGFAVVFVGCAAVVTTIVEDNTARTMRRMTCYVSIIFFVFGSISVFVPTTKEMVAIYVVPALTNNEQVRSIPDTALKLADEYLKQKLDELVGEKHKK